MTRGRGRPATFDTPAREKYLRLREDGHNQAEAAAALGITAHTVRNARREPAFRTADDQAAAIGRPKRLPHGESRYNHHGCRCPICTEAATAARTSRPDRTHQENPVTTINPPPAASSPSFPLARAS